MCAYRKYGLTTITSVCRVWHRAEFDAGKPSFANLVLLSCVRRRDVDVCLSVVVHPLCLSLSEMVLPRFRSYDQRSSVSFQPSSFLFSFFFFSMQLLMLFFLGAVTAVITVWCYHCRCSPLKASSWEVWTVNVVERHNSSSGRLILLTLVSYVSDLFYGRLKLSTYFLGKEM